jgi:hypothetical protein
MRSTSGPDISDFQSRVSAAEASVFDAVTMGLEDHGTTEPPLPRHAPAPGSEALEPYSPGMLPGNARINPGQDLHADTRIDRYSMLAGEHKADGHAAGRTPNGTASSWETLQTRRESLLRKPLDSLLKR